MKRTTINKHELLKPLYEAGKMVLHMVSSTPAGLMNTIPFAGSWTIAEVVSHLTKSNKAIEQSLQMK